MILPHVGACGMPKLYFGLEKIYPLNTQVSLILDFADGSGFNCGNRGSFPVHTLFRHTCRSCNDSAIVKHCEWKIFVRSPV